MVFSVLPFLPSTSNTDVVHCRTLKRCTVARWTAQNQPRQRIFLSHRLPNVQPMEGNLCRPINTGLADHYFAGENLDRSNFHFVTAAAVKKRKSEFPDRSSLGEWKMADKSFKYVIVGGGVAAVSSLIIPWSSQRSVSSVRCCFFWLLDAWAPIIRRQ